MWRKMHAVLTLLTVAAAFLLFALIGVVNSVMTEAANSVESAHLLITFAQPTRSEGLPVSLRQQISKVPGVVAVTFNHSFWGTYQTPNNLIGGFAIPKNYFTMFPEYECSPKEWKRFHTIGDAAIVGAKVAKRYEWRLGEEVPVKAPNYTKRNGSDVWTFDIVCIDHAHPVNQQNALFFHWKYFYLSRAKRNVNAGVFIEKIRNPLRTNEIAMSIDAQFENSAHQTMTQSQSEMIQNKVRQVIDLKWITRGIMAATFFTLIFSTGSAISHSIRERMKDFAIIRAIGFRRRVLVMLAICEAALLYTSGGTIGMLAAWMLGARVLNYLKGYIGMLVGSSDQFEMQGLWVHGIGLMLAFSIVIGVMAGGRVVRMRLAETINK